MRYVIDTSGLVDAWNDWYHIDVVPSFWRNLESSGERGHITIPETVLWELESRDDDLCAWVRERQVTLVTKTIEAVQNNVGALTSKYKNFGGLGPGTKNFADPFVVATALHFECAVVSNESASNNMNGPMLPDICAAENLKHLRIPAMVKREQWQLSS